MDVDENHAEADPRPLHALKAAQSPQPPALKPHLTNGSVVDGIEPEDSDPESNEAPPSLDSSELSPTLRRSTRAACLKAQENWRTGRRPRSPPGVPELSAQTTAANAEVMETPQKKKRKLSNGAELDQDDCKFGIRLDDDGDAVLMTDESDISSLKSEEIAVIRQKFEEAKSKLDELTPEARRQREFQLRELETALRLEEGKLAMLKKIRANQQLTQRNTAQDAARRSVPGASQNSSTAAYKPPVAQQTNARSNGTSNAAALAAAAAKANQRGKNAKPGTSPLGPSANAARQQALQREQQQQKEAQERERRQQAEREAAARKAAEAQAAAERLARENAQNAQQKIAAARVQFRRIAEQRMLAALPPPKAPAADLSFVPNAAQPDFLYLLGLDLVVQRNLKDKNVFKKVEFDPYVCEECGTDFTPNWKAIAGEKGDLHLYCEQCLRQAQKRRVRHDRNILLKKLFTKINDEEKEFERQIQNGKLAETLGAVSSLGSSKADSKADVKVETPPISKNSGLPANFNAAALSNLVNNMKGLPHSASSLLNSAAASSSSSANRNATAAANLASASRSAVKQEVKKPAPSTPSRGQKRGHSGSSSNSNALNSQLAALANNPQGLATLMSQLQSFQAMRNLNPAAFGNVTPQAILQLMSQLSAFAQNQNHSASTANSAASNHQQSSHHGGSSGGGASSTSAAANLLQQSLLQQMAAGRKK
ncbi:P66-CC domain-containing protein [Aphelenchoides fujianensis]|nr:P66-CC domain-containing protein [Aphelenchoides fujianensis]